MKGKRYIQSFNEHQENLNISDVMKRSLEYYKYIDVMGEELAEIISEQIEPLLDKGKYDEAKQMVRDFYKPSRYKQNDESEGDVIFIEYDMILANINRTSLNNRLKIEPVYDGISTAVTQYKITDDLGNIWMQGTRDECKRYLYGR